IEARMTGTGRKTGESAAFPEGMLEAIVTGDERIKKELIPAAEAIKASVSFDTFQRILADNPGASQEQIVKICAAKVNKAGDTYAEKLGTQLCSLFDDFMAVARFRTRDDKFSEPQKFGIGPTTDERVAINGAYRLAAFRNREVIKTLRIWAGA